MIELRRRYSIGSGWASRLPAEYQQVQYIEGNGSQFLDFKITYNKVIINWSFTKLGNYFVLGTDIVGNEIYTWNKTWDGLFRGQTPNPKADVIYTAILNVDRQSELYEEGMFLFNGEAFYLHSKIRLNSMNRSGETGYIGYNKFYSVEAYKDDVCVLSLIPCYRKADNEAGMYDIVNNQFYTNIGTGEFIVGADVN